MPNVVDANQFRIVDELLQRQDEALEELEQLNVQVEAAIVEINALRSNGDDDGENEVDRKAPTLLNSDENTSEVPDSRAA